MLIQVETDVGAGLPEISLVGFLSSSVREARERVRTAIRNSGFSIPPKRITVNLYPADIRKEGTGFDFAIAMGILCSMGVVPPVAESEKTIFIGELGLDGSLHGVAGVLPILDHARQCGIRRAFVPAASRREASLIRDMEILSFSTLSAAVSFFLSGEKEHPEKEENAETVRKAVGMPGMGSPVDFSEIHGQVMMKRGVTVAVAGFHNILLTGAAGAGKSMIARAVPGIMPPLSYDESLELTKIYSVAGKLPRESGLMNRRPIRAPHQSITESALLGGGSVPKPGEVSLASHGVLFLDEFPEFRRQVIESLRQPMEERRVLISRVRASCSFPASFMLIAARNHCPCGFYPDREKCSCSPRAIAEYQSRISHPIMDRIDIRLEVRPVPFSDLTEKHPEEGSHVIRDRIMAARERQERRYAGEGFHFNSELPQGKIEQYIRIGQGERKLLRQGYETGELSARGYFKVMRLARTIADVEDHEEITEGNIREASFYRNTEVGNDRT